MPAIVSEATVQKVLRLRSYGKTYTEIEKEASVSRPTVANIVLGKVRAHVPESKPLCVKLKKAKRCGECRCLMKIWSTEKDQCWACTVREGM